MSVRIVLDQPEHRCYTNLDFITGTVHLVLPNDATISAITVKLEAESRTRLSAPKFPENERSDKKRVELELHKLLYKVVTVFPAPDVKERSTSVAGYTLLAGQYVYPFSIKFPFNNDCTNTPNALKDIKMGQVNVSFAPVITKHVKQTLPPSLPGFPGEAEIKYYIKATVVRPKFFQENLRSVIDIKFLPIEPPRPPDTHEETYARRKRQFQRYSGSQPQQQKKTLFRKNSATESAEEEPPAFQVDARLPSPAIITCNEPLPLRILVEKLNNSSATAFLSMLQIELIGYTHIRAHDLERVESVSWILMSHANMNMPLGNPIDKGRREWKLPSRLWKDHPIPNTVAPTFETCNLSRRYELEIRVGLAHGLADGVRPELIVLPLKLPVEVYSGIAPPEKLLQAMANNPRPQPTPAPLFPRPSNMSQTPSPAYPQGMHVPTPTTATPTTNVNPFPAPIGQVNTQQSYQVPDDAPPSYEDAIADEIAPVDGPRRDYHPSGSGNVQLEPFNPDSKSGLNRRFSERLFPSNAPSFEQHRASEASAMSSTPIPEHGPESPSPSVETPSSPSRSQIWKQNLSKRLSGEKQ
ncbi:hypothetical protein PV10_03376 [Exophiala mesophila]|uniref:Arrestin-like N-terminal domain-containing protein n=2 Tax=Exophiala mesophila TaxID=212818 RepID=A0A0D1X1V8_EXOME|nr:uncharacterized protein PV10_03376 [Exophiala mesophila]KIV95760.1 hypothetical protein PV10_03376 [Exophiala mesophila]